MVNRDGDESMKNKLIGWLGGYTKADMAKVGSREFDNYGDSARLAGFLPEGAEFRVLCRMTGGAFMVRKYEDLTDNGGTILNVDSQKPQ